jgi:hypothetical protein
MALPVLEILFAHRATPAESFVDGHHEAMFWHWRISTRIALEISPKI